MSNACLQCPWPSCRYKTPGLEGTVAIQLLQMHQGAVHTVAGSPAQDRKPQTKLPHLDVSADGNVTEAAMGIGHL